MLSGNYDLSCSSKDEEGNIYIGSKKGIDYFNPSQIKPEIKKPKLKIVRYKISGETVYPGSDTGPAVNKNNYIMLNHTENILDFEYIAIHFSSTNNDKYSYKLSPLQSDWINVDNNKNINFSNLKPGFYELSLKVLTEKGISSTKENIVKFYIKPPFWQTFWFKSLLVIFIALTIILIIRFNTRKLRLNKIRLEKIVHERTLELKQNNKLLEEQSTYLNETNTLLEERQQYIEEQAEELKAQSEKLANTNEELSKLIAMKDKFSSIVAHDLKNPFNTILGFSGLLDHSYENFTEEKRKKIVEYIYTSTKSAYSLLDNLLNWSRAQTQRLEVNPEYLAVKDFIEGNYSLIRATLKRKKLKFETNYDEDLKVYADEPLLNTILRNLLNNAAKFTHEGGIITLNVKPIDQNQICFEVKDTGTGLSEKEIESIFRIDSKISKTGTDGEKGTGLGMLLCKEFIEKLNGKIWIESKENIGTSVFFTLPTPLNFEEN